VIYLAWADQRGGWADLPEFRWKLALSSTLDNGLR
jgi:hypothetical protein